ncbi:MarR family winged helix-turn-helix transcriptional regulator [Actinomyces howellii]|uniref:Transcriptional repressor MprA n=1 Tax=Actinomyces howellii TaxID=52771 RepID=A0A448HER8_9ACTO|nr:MarR family winged helix-turn-helix transcriptional regulator [Actinomyces howellii]VEG26562.1 transcriptional repressor MprA [Actinomyces howellii]
MDSTATRTDEDSGPRPEELAAELLEHVGGIHRPAGRELRGSLQGERAVLHHLERCGQSSSPGELAEALHLSSARIANILKALERKGWVERVHDSRDRRRVRVRLTDHGVQCVARFKHEAVTTIGAIIEALGEPDGTELVRIIGRVRSLVEAGVITMPPPPPD